MHMGKEQMIVVGGILGSLVLIVIGAVVYNNMKFGGDPSKMINKGRFIHWHSDITATVCGQEQQMPKAAPGGTIGQHGGLHTHEDGRAHIEGIFKSAEDTALGKWLSAIGFPYSERGILDKADGSPCAPTGEATESADTSSGKLHGTVNGNETPNILDYPMKDGDKIRLIYD